MPDPATGTKTCSKCRLPKRLDDYYLDRRTPGKRQARCKACAVAQVREYQARLRDKVLAAYGRSCRCCGATSSLSIDHVAGDGGQHRRELLDSLSAEPGGLSQYLDRWLIKNNFPDGFQTLCSACNNAKRSGSSCKIHGKYLGAEQDQVALTA